MIQKRILTFFLTLLVLSALVISTTPAWGQANATGTVIGVVTDPTGAVVPGATVTLTDLATGTTRVLTSNEQGRYAFPNTAPGTYSITVNKQGFATAKLINQAVSVGQQLTANVQLSVGGTQTEVVVEGQATATLQTLNATVGDTLAGKQIDQLPNLGRDVSTLTVLQPGVSPTGSVAGAMFDQNTYQLDGGNNTNDMDGSMTIYTPSFASDPSNNGGANGNYYGAGVPTGVMPTPVESIEEFKVATNNQTADFNGSSGGQIQMVTKRGTKSWHGAAYEYYYGSYGGANTWDNNNNGAALTKFHRNRFGGSGGGPILPKMLGGKTYFFANYEGSRYPNASTFRKTVPTATFRSGIIGLTGVSAADCTAGGGVNSTSQGGKAFCGYNLNPAAVTVNGVNYPGTGTLYDPRGLGFNPIVNQLWSKYMPLPNNFKKGDLGVNTATYDAPIALGQRDNFGVARIDHDFGDKWHFTSSYRYYKLTRASTSQVDVGGALAGDTFGVPTAKSSRPQVPWFLVMGLTTNLTSNVTNDIHFSYLRNYWSWATSRNTPQPIAGLGGALEIGGESSGALIPYNVDTQSVRTRFWDGQDSMYRDDLNMLKGNHLFQMGVTFERNFDWHERNDNGGGVMINPTYRIQSLVSTTMAPYQPTAPTTNCDSSGNCAGLSSSQKSSWNTLYAEALGIVALPQTLYIRGGSDLHLLASGIPAQQKSQINSYNVYFSDTWHMKPTFTLTYGMGYLLQMPPKEESGRQVAAVDEAGNTISAAAYMKTKMTQALLGNVYNPMVGYALVGNANGGMKYPYNVFYGGFSPRVSAAWNPKFDSGIMEKIFGKDSTVIRGGWSRLYGRLNGVDLVLVPLLGTGLMQPVQCNGARKDGVCTGVSSAVDPTNAFRIGPTGSGFDGMVAPVAAAQATLPQPYFPGTPLGSPTGALNPPAGAGESLDPNFRPSSSDQFDLTIQRALSSKVTLEFGYIGRLMRNEYQAINLDAVPYMLTKGGQSFAKAYAAIETAIGCTVNTVTCGGKIPSSSTDLKNYANTMPAQPFFEAAINPTYCAGFTSCTAAVFYHEADNFQSQSVYDMWNSLSTYNTKTGLLGFNFGRSLPSSPDTICASTSGCTVPQIGTQVSALFQNATTGWANYHGAFASVKFRDFHNVTGGATFTFSKTMGTNDQYQASSEFTEMDPYVLKNNYGLAPWDQKYVLNTYLTLTPPWYKNQQGLLGRVLGGWAISPVFTASSAIPIEVNQNGCQSAGEGDCNNVYAWENAVKVRPIQTSGSRLNVPYTSSMGDVASNSVGFNIFKDPVAAYNSYRPWILGLDTKSGAAGNLRGLPSWNTDLSVTKDLRVWERVGIELHFLFLNVFNHDQMYDPYPMNITDAADWGVINGQMNTPRRMEFGIRVHF